MSGNHFEYKQYSLSDIADDIDHIVKNNHIKNEFGYATDFAPKTISKFKKVIDLLKEAKIYVTRIDWLISGDDGEESFHERLKEDLQELKSSMAKQKSANVGVVTKTNKKQERILKC